MHRFEARYDKSPVDLSQFSELKGGSLAFFEKFRKVTYVRDVCTRCGTTIERSGEVVTLDQRREVA